MGGAARQAPVTSPALPSCLFLPTISQDAIWNYPEREPTFRGERSQLSGGMWAEAVSLLLAPHRHSPLWRCGSVESPPPETEDSPFGIFDSSFLSASGSSCRGMGTRRDGRRAKQEHARIFLVAARESVSWEQCQPPQHQDISPKLDPFRQGNVVDMPPLEATCKQA